MKLKGHPVRWQLRAWECGDAGESWWWVDWLECRMRTVGAVASEGGLGLLPA